MRQEWSPEQIAGTMNISYETVYRHIYADKECGGKLFMHLRIQKKRRKRYASGRQRRGQIPNRRSIHERPAVVDLRLEVGHWEGDTVIRVRHKQAIVTLVERKSGYAKLFKVKNKTAELVSAAMIKSLIAYLYISSLSLSAGIKLDQTSLFFLMVILNSDAPMATGIMPRARTWFL